MNPEIKLLLDMLAYNNTNKDLSNKYNDLVLRVGDLNTKNEYSQVKFRFDNDWEVSVVIDYDEYSVEVRCDNFANQHTYTNLNDVLNIIETVGNY